jgi:hypothetical protein
MNKLGIMSTVFFVQPINYMHLFKNFLAYSSDGRRLFFGKASSTIRVHIYGFRKCKPKQRVDSIYLYVSSLGIVWCREFFELLFSPIDHGLNIGSYKISANVLQYKLKLMGSYQNYLKAPS